MCPSRLADGLKGGLSRDQSRENNLDLDQMRENVAREIDRSLEINAEVIDDATDSLQVAAWWLSAEILFIALALASYHLRRAMSTATPSTPQAEPERRSVFTDAVIAKGATGTDRSFLAKLFGLRSQSLTAALKRTK